MLCYSWLWKKLTEKYGTTILLMSDNGFYLMPICRNSYYRGTNPYGSLLHENRLIPFWFSLFCHWEMVVTCTGWKIHCNSVWCINRSHCCPIGRSAKSMVFHLTCGRVETTAAGMFSDSWAGHEEQDPWLLSPATSFAILSLVQPVAGFRVTTPAVLRTWGAPRTCHASVSSLMLQRCHLGVSHFTRRWQQCVLRTPGDLQTEIGGDYICCLENSKEALEKPEL